DLLIEVMLSHVRICHVVPEVLDVTIPKLPDLSLFRGSGCAVNEPETFYLIEGLSISGACECWRRMGKKLVGPLQCKWSDLRQLGKICWREVRWRQLVVSGLGPRQIHRWRYIRSVGTACGEEFGGDCLADSHSLSFSLIIGKLHEVLLE